MRSKNSRSNSSTDKNSTTSKRGRTSGSGSTAGRRAPMSERSSRMSSDSRERQTSGRGSNDYASYHDRYNNDYSGSRRIQSDNQRLGNRYDQDYYGEEARFGEFGRNRNMRGDIGFSDIDESSDYDRYDRGQGQYASDLDNSDVGRYDSDRNRNRNWRNEESDEYDNFSMKNRYEDEEDEDDGYGEDFKHDEDRSYQGREMRNNMSGSRRMTRPVNRSRNRQSREEYR